MALLHHDKAADADVFRGVRVEAAAQKLRYGAPQRWKGWRTPRPGGIRHGPLSREASWSAVALYRFSPAA